ncbi:molecular chaperone GrpE [Sphingomonas gellani]|uniref:Protein GrpE n=1 Tax=Sphingomonas gellani TaxID=1166340 RepID=A0A1H7YPP6_9SPHN|nr:nucleotide exchange factor GrpE [Sphingomonas gellani]SEM47881.1 molecular chaperone GrpE [Sphingomonas gellani]
MTDTRIVDNDGTTPETEDLRAETAGSAPEVAEHDQAQGRIAELEAQLAESKQQTLYARAEVENVRRRAEREATDARAYAATGFARDILSVADNLSRGLAAIPAEMRADEKLKGLVTGLEATGRELESVFARNGITRIQAMGATLDPNKHQAMMEMPTADAEPGTVVTEMQAGYMIKDRLLRPALVGVAKKPD